MRRYLIVAEVDDEGDDVSPEYAELVEFMGQYSREQGVTWTLTRACPSIDFLEVSEVTVHEVRL